MEDLRWSPDERKLRITLLDRKRESSAEWGIPLATLVPRRLFAISKGEPFVLGGAWTRDGKYFFYGAGPYRRGDIWVSRESTGWWPFASRGLEINQWRTGLVEMASPFSGTIGDFCPEQFRPLGTGAIRYEHEIMAAAMGRGGCL